MKTRQILLGAGFALSAGLAIWGDSADVPPSQDSASSNASRPAASAGSRPRTYPGSSASGEASASSNTVRPRNPLSPARQTAAPPRIDEISPRVSPSEETAPPEASALMPQPRRTLFAMQSWAPAPVPAPAPPAPPIRASAPPLPFTYVGKKLESGAWEVYLAVGESTFFVKDQTVVNGNYRVDSIAPPILRMTYLPLNQTQTLMIGDHY